MSGAASAVVFSGGFGHPFAETSPDLETVVEDLPTTELLVVNALYWSMVQDEKYAPLRERWAFHLGDDQMDALNDFVGGGGRLMVVHTGVICWPDAVRVTSIAP
jgi:uncharacterized protein